MSKTLTLLRGDSTETSTVERRLQERVRVSVPGEMKIINNKGQLIIGHIFIEDWNDAGCRFEAAIPLKAGDIVAIKPLKTDEKTLQDREPHLFEIAWTSRRVVFWIAGASKLQGEKLASVKFSLANYSSERRPK
jgi:hypothetical protein